MLPALKFEIDQLLLGIIGQLKYFDFRQFSWYSHRSPHMNEPAVEIDLGSYKYIDAAKLWSLSRPPLP